jgi:hypothetical protein
MHEGWALPGRGSAKGPTCESTSLPVVAPSNAIRSRGLGWWTVASPIAIRLVFCVSYTDEVNSTKRNVLDLQNWRVAPEAQALQATHSHRRTHAPYIWAVDTRENKPVRGSKPVQLSEVWAHEPRRAPNCKLEESWTGAFAASAPQPPGEHPPQPHGAVAPQGQEWMIASGGLVPPRLQECARKRWAEPEALLKEWRKPPQPEPVRAPAVEARPPLPLMLTLLAEPSTSSPHACHAARSNWPAVAAPQNVTKELTSARESAGSIGTASKVRRGSFGDVSGRIVSPPLPYRFGTSSAGSADMCPQVLSQGTVLKRARGVPSDIDDLSAVLWRVSGSKGAADGDAMARASDRLDASEMWVVNSAGEGQEMQGAATWPGGRCVSPARGSLPQPSLQLQQQEKQRQQQQSPGEWCQQQWELHTRTQGQETQNQNAARKNTTLSPLPAQERHVACADQRFATALHTNMAMSVCSGVHEHLFADVQAVHKVPADAAGCAAWAVRDQRGFRESSHRECNQGLSSHSETPCPSLSHPRHLPITSVCHMPVVKGVRWDPGGSTSCVIAGPARSPADHMGCGQQPPTSVVRLAAAPVCAMELPTSALLEKQQEQPGKIIEPSALVNSQQSSMASLVAAVGSSGGVADGAHAAPAGSATGWQPACSNIAEAGRAVDVRTGQGNGSVEAGMEGREREHWPWPDGVILVIDQEPWRAAAAAAVAPVATGAPPSNDSLQREAAPVAMVVPPSNGLSKARPSPAAAAAEFLALATGDAPSASLSDAATMPAASIATADACVSIPADAAAFVSAGTAAPPSAAPSETVATDVHLSCRFSCRAD